MATNPRKKDKIKTKIQGIALPIKWNIPDNIITRFASNMVIQILENEFKISFFEVNPDINIGMENKIPDEVEANCVASIIVNANRLPSFIEVLQRQYDLFQKIKSESILPATPSEPEQPS